MHRTLKCYQRCCLFLLLFLTWGGLALAQTITGKVIDSASRRPIPNASVYLNGSSIGTTSNEQGEFTLQGKGGNVPLIVSFIGYESAVINKHGNEALTVVLAPKARMLNEVTINVGGMPREQQLALFLKEFLGNPADGCTIVNTDELKFRYSKKANSLSATADAPLQIINKRTGYKISYFLKSFLYTDTSFRIRGTYFFTEDTAGLKPAELRKVLKNRETYYFGSKMHFIRSLWADNLKKNKFELFNNSYFGKESIPVKAVVSTYQGQKYFNYKESLSIVYRNNKISSLRLAPGRTEGIIDSDGYYDPDFYWWGEMAGQRLAQLLPFEYWPSGEAQSAPANEPVAKQPIFDSILTLYGAKHRSPLLFMHFDKNVYSNNENVWFTGYLLDQANLSPYKTLSLALVKNDDRNVLIDDRFVIANGFCFGNTNIPDSARAGAYTFVAYGNRLENNQPDVIFTQQVTIKTGSQQLFNASLNPLDTSATAANQKVMLLVNFVNEKSPPSSVPVTYYVGDARKPAIAGAVKTALGQYIFTIPSNLLSPANNSLNVQVKYKTEVQDISITLPVPSQPPRVNFYPEGGNLLSGNVNIVGLEAKTAGGAPLNTEFALYEDEKIISSAITNDTGLGKFAVIPKPGKKYYIRSVSDNNNKDYILPDAVAAPGISVKRAIVNDTLLVDVYNNDPRRRLYLVGHNYQRSFFETPVGVSANQRLKIILTDVPRGIIQLTLVDTLGRPFAERLAFAHYDNESKLELGVDKAEYETRKKVRLSIRLKGEAINGAVSVAVVQGNRIELKNAINIENYIYLKSELNELPAKGNYFSNANSNRGDLENVLLIKGWSRYKWTDVLKIKAADTAVNNSELVFTGKVSKYAGKLKDPVPVVTLDPSGAYYTDVNGGFLLPDSNLVTQVGKKVTLMVANGTPSDYKIQLINPYDSVTRKLANLINPDVYHLAVRESSKDLKLPGMNRTILLKEAVIKSKKEKTDMSFYAIPPPCGPYVCHNGVVNCPNHVPPQCKVGYVAVLPKPRPNAIQFKGIYAAQEFYPADYSEVSPSQPEYLSTLYWKNQLMLKKDETHDVTFYTGDITGDFKVIVQGVTEKDVIYAETAFKVK